MKEMASGRLACCMDIFGQRRLGLKTPFSCWF